MNKNEMKEYLKEAWRELFPESDADDSSDFFAEGGDSIKAVQLVGWLLQKGVKLEMLKIFTTPILGEMAEYLEETQPMVVPKEMMTKEILRDRFGIDPAFVSKYPEKSGKRKKRKGNKAAYKKWRKMNDRQLCTPANLQNAWQMCTPQDAYNAWQMCTPQDAYNAWQMCTPADTNRFRQLCTPNNQPFGGMGMPYGAPMNMYPMMYMLVPVMVPVFMPQGFYPMQNGQFPLMQGGYHGPGKKELWSALSKYQARPAKRPVRNPYFTKINEPEVGSPEESAADVLMNVLSGIYEDYDPEDDLFSQGFTSLNLMQIVTRCAEQGYRVKIEDIIKNPTFDGIVECMVPGEDDE